MTPEIWITGLGVVAPFARDVAELASLGDGAPAATLFPGPFPLERFLDPATVRKVARASELAQLAVAATAQLSLPGPLRANTGVFWGTCFGPASYRLEYDKGVVEAPAQASPLRFAEGVSNAASAHVSRVFGLKGASLTVLGGEDAGLSAIVAARDRLANGAPGPIVAGGAEERSDLIIRAAGRLGLLGETPGRFVQGAAALLLERADSARARGATPLARIDGVARARGSTRDEAVRRASSLALGASGPGLAPRSPPGHGFAFTSALAVLLAVLSRKDALVVASTPTAATALVVRVPGEP